MDILFEAALSPTFLAIMAPIIKPNPQLNMLQTTAISVTNRAAVAVVLQKETMRFNSELIGLERART